MSVLAYCLKIIRLQFRPRPCNLRGRTTIGRLGVRSCMLHCYHWIFYREFCPLCSELHSDKVDQTWLEVLTWFESVIKRDFLLLNFETTEELLGISGLSENAGSTSGSVPVLPWIPQTTAAVTLRLLELGDLISYAAEQKAELEMGDESTDVIVEKTLLKFTVLKNWETLDTDHKKPLKLPRGGGGGRSRGGGKLQKWVAGPISIPGSSKPNVTFTISQAIKQQTHGTGRRTIRRKIIEKPPEEEPVRNFNVEEWIHNPLDRMETDNANLHVVEEVNR